MRRLCLILACIAVVLGLGTTLPAFAQSPFSPQSPEAAEEPAGEAPARLPADSVRVLVDTIEDPDSRAALLELLRQVAAGTEETDAAAAASSVEVEEPTQATRVADGLSDYAQAIAETATDLTQRALSSFRGLTGVATGRIAVDWERFGDAALRLAIVAGVTFAAYYLVRLFARRLFDAVARAAGGRTFVGTLVGLVVLAVVDEAAVLFAWAAGYVFALTTGEAGGININQSLFLNAFLVVETIKVVLRMILSPTRGELRIIGMSDKAAGYWYFWTSRLVGLIGYGFLLFVPIVNINVSFFAGRGLRMLIALLATGMAIFVILHSRREVAGAIQRFGHRMGSFGRSAAAVLARLWHAAAILYVLVFFVIWLSRPGEALSYMISATLQSFAAIVLAAIVMALISRMITGGISLPEDVKARLPLLESRLNRLVPTILKVVRFVLLALVVLAILHAWRVIDVLAWADDEAGAAFLGGLTSAAIVALVATAIWLAMSSWIDYRLNPSFGKVPTARERTLLSLFKNAFTIAVILFGSMIALSEIGVDIGPLLAGAGVLGLAIGFGAQKLVQDIITGIFIQFENAMNEGDVVAVGGISGVVEKLTVRSVSLRDIDGIYHLIPFSSVDSVSNFMRGFGYHKAEIGVAYRENIADVKAHMHIAFDRLMETEHGPKILEPLDMHGVTEFADSAVMVRARIKTRPGDQWAVGRAYNEILKEVFDEASIEIPFPHMTLWWGEDKKGDAPPLRVRRARDTEAAALPAEPTEPEGEARQSTPDVGTEHSADVTGREG
ncbi:mechanosensitive ion channel domain-containing protein [Lutibaculum baratangense]|uniref:Potassium efflux system KefA protein n=1 Tax=Lutibaculum baratangense AMV1 TaxID=631454 RepID=V4R0J6_9HYPH|nr:mechanosensitive ion channel domain-containing protein [Lutibaculum baratangense]ESR25512.1 Potassium efflux system KefA protein [Lutibaculum baratangense AMV1]